MTDSSSTTLDTLRKLDREARLLEHSAAVLSWDQETYMPEGAVVERSQQLALLQGLVHQRNRSQEIGDALSQFIGDPRKQWNPELSTELQQKLSVEDVAFLREKHRQYRHAIRVPDQLVHAMAEGASRSQGEWVRARRDNDYSRFQPWLEKMVRYNQELAEHLEYADQPYDALLDQYEPNMKTGEVATIFTALREQLIELVTKIENATPVDTTFLGGPFPVDLQEQFNTEILHSLGYELDRGRLDRSAHPFTTTLGSNDVRITTRYDQTLLLSSIFSTIHEIGHGLYELGVGETLRGTLLAEGTSLGIHESQSRMWENMIGRSQSFWSHWFPRLQETFPVQLGPVHLEQFYRAVNHVERSLIRVEADEVTYSLHIILRFELEQALINGDVSVSDLPEAWREKSKELLGVVPETDALGVLQDVHWSMGAFGYFPTYALGNLYAAQFYEALSAQVGDIPKRIGAGEYAPILRWLREHIHQYGRVKTAGELVQDITGGPLNAQPFVNYLTNKYRDIYHF
jgi:carboxypeptidase Taq